MTLIAIEYIFQGVQKHFLPVLFDHLQEYVRVNGLLATCDSSQHPPELLAGFGQVQEDVTEERRCQTGDVQTHRNQIPQQELLLWDGQPRHDTAADGCRSRASPTLRSVMLRP